MRDPPKSSPVFAIVDSSMMTHEECEQVVRSHGVEVETPGDVVDAIVSGLKPSIRLVPTLAPTKTGQSHIGGTPDASPSFDWPRSKSGIPLAFLLQVNFEDISRFDIENKLPNTGLIHVFFEWDDKTPPLEEEHCISFDRGESLVSERFPADLVPSNQFKKLALEPQLEWTIPSPDEIGMGNFYGENLDLLTFWDEAPELLEEHHGFGPFWTPKHRLLGSPDFIQAPGLADESLLLLQIDSDPPYSCGSAELRTGMMWGDCGRIFWVTDARALAEEDLSRHRPFWECC